jgi:hypothetical protein
MAARITYLLMAIGAIMIGASGLGVGAFLDVVGVTLMVFGAIGAAVALDSAESPRPAEQPVRIGD